MGLISVFVWGSVKQFQLARSLLVCYRCSPGPSTPGAVTPGEGAEVTIPGPEGVAYRGGTLTAASPHYSVARAPVSIVGTQSVHLCGPCGHRPL